MKSLWFVLAGLAVVAVQGPGPAQFGGAASPGYEVTPGLGPWMILTTSYTGPAARDLATKMVDELRSRYNLPAFLFNFVDEERKKEQERVDKLRKQQEEYLAQMNLAPGTPIRIRTRRFEDQFAVLIGGYKDEETARKELVRVKQLPAAVARQSPAAAGAPKDNGFTAAPGSTGANANQQVWTPNHVNPFAQSFVVPNPTIKREPAADRNQLDPGLKKFNAGESYSLLKCPKRFTLAVAQFRGATVVESTVEPNNGKSGGFLEKIGLGGAKPGDSLAASAMNAHRLAEFFRKLNFEAYVLHTRYASVVTVGAFDSPDDPQLNATKHRMEQIKLNPDPLLPQFLPMAVPRF
jgi:hypothetical protein